MSSSPKIIDILNAPRCGDDDKPYISLEYFPPRSDEGVENLHKRMDRMKETIHPAFTDMTWGAGGSTADLSLDLALYAQKTGHVSNMHLTCTNIQNTLLAPKDAVLEALKKAYNGGIRNIVALRGDPPAGETEWKAAEGGFACALDLVLFIKEHFADDFGIAVAGYPEGHPNAISEISDLTSLSTTEQARASQFDGKTYCCLDADYKKEMDYLKAKIDAGADFIITQMFFDAKVYKSFVHDCREWGITCPIIPGIMCINGYAGFCKMTKFCKTRVPTQLQASMDAIQYDADQVKDFGIAFGTQLCKDLVEMNAPVLHFYTLNLEKVVYGVLDQLGFLDQEGIAQSASDADAASQIAKGSAWARVGDHVACFHHGNGIVLEIDAATGSAKVRLDAAADGEGAIVDLDKGQYTKIF